MSFSQIISRINRIANSYKSSFSSYDEDLKVAEEYINSYNKNKEIYDEIIDKQEDLEFINAYKLLDVDKDDKLETIVNSFRKLLKSIILIILQTKVKSNNFYLMIKLEK